MPTLCASRQLQWQLWHLRASLRAPLVIAHSTTRPLSRSHISSCAACGIRYAPSHLCFFGAMHSSGFTNAPVSQFLVFSTVIGALLATVTDTRYYLHIQVVPHVWKYGQFWRFMTWQVCRNRVDAASFGRSCGSGQMCCDVAGEDEKADTWARYASPIRPRFCSPS